MKINSRFLKLILMTIATVSMLGSSCFAAWWGTPGYEWGLTKGLTSVKSQASLDQKVSHSDLYNTILKYLKMKGIQPSGNTIHHKDDMTYLNNVVAGLFDIINSYNSRTTLTPDEYRIVASYIDHGRETFYKYRSNIRNDIKNVDLYLALSKYRAAKMIDDREYREYVLSQLGGVKYKEILEYGVIPYVCNISRREFLLLMHSLLSNQSLGDEEVIRKFNDTGVLVGYQNDLMLDKELTYTEMLTFLYRFEIYDFTYSVSDVAEETNE